MSLRAVALQLIGEVSYSLSSCHSPLHPCFTHISHHIIMHPMHTRGSYYTVDTRTVWLDV